MEKGRRSSLLLKLSTIFGLVIIISNVVLGVIAINSASNALETNTTRYMVETATGNAKYLGSEIQVKLATLEGIADNEIMSSMNWEAQQPYLIDYADELGYLDLAVISPDYMANYARSGETSQLSERAVYQNAFNGNSGISDVLISSVTGQPVVLDVVPIHNGSEVVAILMGRRDGTALNDLVDGFKDTETAFSFIISQNGTIDAHTNKQMVLDESNIFEDTDPSGPLYSVGQAFQNIDMSVGGIITYNYEGNRIATVAPIPGTDWVLGVGDMEETIFASLMH